MQKKKMSVITVVYNDRENIEETIKSVITQDYSNIEYVVIDGGSTDGTYEIILKYKDYISYCCSEEDEGIYDAMNKALEVISGEIILFLNSGDVFFDNSVVSDMLGCMGFDTVAIIGGVLYDTGISVRSSITPKTFIHNTVHHQSAFYRADLFGSFRFNKIYNIAAVYELNLLLYKNYSSRVMCVDRIVSKCSDD
ncbi:glycosyltransferase, partial [bacterium]|nr:glycosyltransferase [bacterium]